MWTCPRCGLGKEYRCSTCGQCYQCKHIYVEHADGWWVKCKQLMKWKKALPDPSMIGEY